LPNILHTTTAGYCLTFCAQQQEATVLHDTTANAQQSRGYVDKVLFLTIGHLNIYQHKSLGKFATDFYPIRKWERVTNKY
jgi:hypothetical protein